MEDETRGVGVLFHCLSDLDLVRLRGLRGPKAKGK